MARDIERHHINSTEFENWLTGLDSDTRECSSRTTLYDFWVDGYSPWEVEAIIG